MTKQPKIETQRLLLASFSPESAKKIYRYWQVTMMLQKNILNISHPYENGMAED